MDNTRNNSSVHVRAVVMKRLLLLLLLIPLLSQADTNFYVDPDWTGTSAGYSDQPFNVLNSTAWSTINSALGNDNVTVYFSALKTDGVTQQSHAWFIQGRRTSPSAYRLTLDGYSQYNNSETCPGWRSNPVPDIGDAYLNGKVFKTTGNGSQAIGWARIDGNDFVTNNGLTYCCVESHLASADNEPGVGANWQLYWDQHGTSNIQWLIGTAYKCYVKQNNVTVRGFEVTGSGARAAFAGDNFIYEYVYLHDITGIGAGLTILYTSWPDSSLAQIIERPSNNMIFRNFRVQRTYGEGFYLGSINPSAPAAFQALHGNQHSNILIEKFLISDSGINGAQGDAIDCKNGITHLTIRDGEITSTHSGQGVIVPETASNADQGFVAEHLFIHDLSDHTFGGARAIYGATDGATATTMYGYVGVTVRNCVIANDYGGLGMNGSAGHFVDQVKFYNNTIYNCGGSGSLGLSVSTTNCEVKNNFVLAGANPHGNIGSSGVISDYNAHDGTWRSVNEGSHTLTLTSTVALVSIVNPSLEDFHLVSGTPLIGAGATIDSFLDDFSGATRTMPWDIGAYRAQ